VSAVASTFRTAIKATFESAHWPTFEAAHMPTNDSPYKIAKTDTQWCIKSTNITSKLFLSF
jgi:hypothetical protein